MDVKYVNPFLEALTRILSSFGIADVKRGSIKLKDNMHVDLDVTSLVGITGQIRGNIAYSLSQATAKKIVSAMMMGMPVEKLDAIGRSAIAELSNMITGTASSILSECGHLTDITPPSIIFGCDIYFIISSVQTVSVEMETSVGKIEVNIGLEI
jgi:chemotaxis protein CheX